MGDLVFKGLPIKNVRLIETRKRISLRGFVMLSFKSWWSWRKLYRLMVHCLWSVPLRWKLAENPKVTTLTAEEAAEEVDITTGEGVYSTRVTVEVGGRADGPVYSSLVFAVNTLQPQSNLFSLILQDLRVRKLSLNNLCDLNYLTLIAQSRVKWRSLQIAWLLLEKD